MMRNCLILTLLLSALPALATDQLMARGEARALEGGELLYSEEHRIDIEARAHRVDYRSPAGDTIVTKTLHYPGKLHTPAFRQHDLRTTLQTGSEILEQGYLLFHQKGADGREENRIDDDGALVIDAGFDHYIREHWDTLLGGEQVPMLFALPQYLSTLPMTLRRVAAAETPISNPREEWEYFIASPSNVLMRMVVPDLAVAYDRESRQLQVFQGISNITDSSGRNQAVRIDYHYQPIEVALHDDDRHQR